MDLFFNGGKTTVSRFFVEAVFLGVAAGLTAGLSFVTNNPDTFSPEWVIFARLVLGLLVNLNNPKLPNT